MLARFAPSAHVPLRSLACRLAPRFTAHLPVAPVAVSGAGAGGFAGSARTVSRPLAVGFHSTPAWLSGSSDDQDPTKVEITIESERATGPVESHKFQAETRQLLDIVAHSLYTDKEVFVRELVSNASDALSKAHHRQVQGQELIDADLDLDIHISCDQDKGIITIQDHGIGMTKDELQENLGTIAHSGTKAFLSQMQDKRSDGAANLIGQFGVGFYSAFMVADQIQVFTQSADPNEPAYMWESDGLGMYNISTAEGVSRGTKVVIHLKEELKEYSRFMTLEEILKKYSNFVGYPIFLNGQKVNTIQALWLKSKNEVTEEQHTEFYRFIAHAYDTPMMRLHYNVEMPVSIRALLYVPTHSGEKVGMSRVDSGVSLYSRKVLIQPKATELLPEWLRFVKGVVDSEDIPLSISRENMQDSSLMRKLKQVLTKRLLKFFNEESKRDETKYLEFYREFQNFFKEGLFRDVEYKDDIAQLLRFETSSMGSGELDSLDSYISRMPEDQEDIFYAVVPNRHYAETSPYYEPFKLRNKEVLFLYNDADDFLMQNMMLYKGKTFTSIEQGASKLDDLPSDESDDSKSEDKLSTEQSSELVDWLKDALGNKVAAVNASTKLVNTPAVIVDHESASVRRLAKLMEMQTGMAMPPKQDTHKLEVNTKHAVILGLEDMRKSNPTMAKLLANTVYDNALIGAGLVDDPRSLVGNLNELMEACVKQHK